jgi:hypothetical protein
MRQKKRQSDICVRDNDYVKLKVENKKTAVHAVREPFGALRNTLRTQDSNVGERENGPSASSRVSAVQHATGNNREGYMDENMSFESASDLGSALRFASGESQKRHLEIDVARYQEYLDDPSLSEGQKTEIVEALWTIMMAFVDLGFGLHPMQQVCEQKACGYPEQSLDSKGETDSNEPEPNTETMSDNFNKESCDE